MPAKIETKWRRNEEAVQYLTFYFAPTNIGKTIGAKRGIDPRYAIE